MPAHHCRVLTPRPYVTAAEVEALRQRSALMIQRCARGWLGRLRAHKLRGEQLAMELFMKEQVGARWQLQLQDPAGTRMCACW
jgi:hypothetical protein